ncbi:uncharacterized protein C8Q71DRAFT_754967 [Rhodofomes roseus]|uniref:Uncharacterized protein n=1 Tax=Rhodofomes roseus TaxID=34475 RepID=A0ABQ8KJ53_9APHY|nr:uncharacterized protein C8Q71DRAFT_754967 [Rhodofomes roseus]KAH9837881.1 hypothetical protein C8Q71DRAFT_754967 [Rhodofomes roseus]
MFDHRKDDPVRFSVLARPQPSPNAAANRPHVDRPTPTPKSSGDFVSASSTSSTSYITLHSLPTSLFRPLQPTPPRPRAFSIGQEVSRK